jgi:hypothetical protein
VPLFDDFSTHCSLKARNKRQLFVGPLCPLFMNFLHFFPLEHHGLSPIFCRHGVPLFHDFLRRVSSFNSTELAPIYCRPTVPHHDVSTFFLLKSTELAPIFCRPSVPRFHEVSTFIFLSKYTESSAFCYRCSVSLFYGFSVALFSLS